MQTQENISESQKERRHYPRTSTPESVLVAASEDFESLPYNIADIGEGGLSFTYIGTDTLFLSGNQVDIYIDEELQIDRIPVELVSDQRLVGFFVPKRRCSLRFGQLTESQRRKLKMFIQQYS